MSSEQIDPRLRDTAPAASVYSQRPPAPPPPPPTVVPHPYPPLQYPALQESPQQQQQQYLPHTPQSAGGHAQLEDEDGAEGVDAKRPRACEQCRNLKVSFEDSFALEVFL